MAQSTIHTSTSPSSPGPTSALASALAALEVVGRPAVIPSVVNMPIRHGSANDRPRALLRRVCGPGRGLCALPSRLGRLHARCSGLLACVGGNRGRKKGENCGLAFLLVRILTTCSENKGGNSSGRRIDSLNLPCLHDAKVQLETPTKIWKRNLLTIVATLAHSVFFLNHGLSPFPSSSAAAMLAVPRSGRVEER